VTDVLDDTAPARRGRRYGQPDEELQAVYDAQPLKVRCGLCAWEYEGPAGEARVAQHEHRLAHVAARPADRKPAAARSQGLSAADRRAVHLKDDREETPVSACKIDGCTAFDRAADAHQDALQALRDQIHSL
jgi:hypothetical protein